MDGLLGTVIEGRSLFALIEWEDGQREEIDQFDRRVVVCERAGA